ncbi:MAG: nucleotidyltransferase family protein [Paludibacteraceae bacterium]|nr:nucleotidyltransferase family protein [Paludibacteraceae bacterium]
MNAMIFAAGLGTRLKPITDTIPKALVSIGGQTLLERTIVKLKRAGFDHIVVNVHHFAGQIIEFLRANQNFGIDIRISDESGQLLETGGGIRKAAPLLGNEPFLIHNVDILSDTDLSALYQAHIHSQADATLLVSRRASSRALLFDDEGRLRAWLNKTTGQLRSPLTDARPETLHEYAFSGIHVFSPSLFPLMEGWPEKFPIMDFYLDVCLRAHLQASVAENLRLIDVGKLNSIAEAESMLAQLS